MRYPALDVFRGLTLALMILVNTPGSWSHIYWPLAHADWHGYTPTDLVFPFFLFIVGASMFFSFHRQGMCWTPALSWHILRRGALLFFIGVGLNALNLWIAGGDWDNLRIMGVLQRIALTYVLAAALVLSLSERGVLLVCAVILFGYWLLLASYPQGFELEHTPVRQFDLWALGESHLWQGKGMAFEPEGLLSGLPALVSLLFGFETCRYLHRQIQVEDCFPRLVYLGVCAVLLGHGWHSQLPINKSLWTSSYVMVSTGWALLTLVSLIYLVQVRHLRFYTFRIFGLNPLFLYILSWVWVSLYLLVPPQGLGQRLYELILAGDMPSRAASLVYALLHLFLFGLVAHGLYKKNVVIKL